MIHFPTIWGNLQHSRVITCSGLSILLRNDSELETLPKSEPECQNTAGNCLFYPSAPNQRQPAVYNTLLYMTTGYKYVFKDIFSQNEKNPNFYVF